MKENRNFSTPSIVSEILFLHLLRVVYPNLEHYSIEKAEGVSEAGFKGICKRKTPLPFAIPSTGKHVNKAGSTLHLDELKYGFLVEITITSVHTIIESEIFVTKLLKIQITRKEQEKKE